MNDKEYDRKWERRRRVQRIGLAAVSAVAALGVILPMVTTLL